MNELLINYQNEVLVTLITLGALAVTRFISIKAIRKVGRISDLNEIRTRLIIKYVAVGHFLLMVAALLFI